MTRLSRSLRNSVKRLMRPVPDVAELILHLCGLSGARMLCVQRNISLNFVGGVPY